MPLSVCEADALFLLWILDLLRSVASPLCVLFAIPPVV